MKLLNRITGLALACLMLSANALAQADVYPSKPIRIILPYGPGSGIDTITRTIAEEMSKSMKQSVVVENRPGANGIIGTTAAAKSAADGYTFVMGASGNFAINVSLYKSLPYDPVKDFAPIALIGDLPYFLIVGKDFPATSLKEFVDLAKAHPGKYTMGYAAPNPQMMTELFKQVADINVSMVAFKATGQVMIDVASGQVDATIMDAASILPHAGSGRYKLLGVTSARRVSLLADVPTIAESGYPYEARTWLAYFAPAGTPPGIVSRLNAEIHRAMQTKAARDRFVSIGLEPLSGGPNELGELVKSDIAKWAKLFESANLPRN